MPAGAGRQLETGHGGGIYTVDISKYTNQVLPTLGSQLLNIYQYTPGRGLLCEGASSPSLEECKQRQSPPGRNEAKGFFLSEQLRANDLRSPVLALRA